MRGMPRDIATKRDYENLLAEGYDMREKLKELERTARIQADVQAYPVGYGELDYKGEKLEPIWKEELNRDGKIYRIGWNLSAVAEVLAAQVAAR